MARCSHCGEPATDTWTLTPCALGRRKIKIALCAACDVALNSLILAFAGVPGRKAAIRSYRKEKRRK